MTVQELINILEQCDKNSTVTVWNAYRDCEDENVNVSYSDDGYNDPAIHIGNMVFGEEITLDTDESWPDPRPVSQENIDAIRNYLNLTEKQIDEIYTLAARM